MANKKSSSKKSKKAAAPAQRFEKSRTLQSALRGASPAERTALRRAAA